MTARPTYVVETCNSCGGLVGWERLREGCCPGGVVCRRRKGTTFYRAARLLSPVEPEPYRGDFEPEAAGHRPPTDADGLQTFNLAGDAREYPR